MRASIHGDGDYLGGASMLNDIYLVIRLFTCGIPKRLLKKKLLQKNPGLKIKKSF